MAQLLIAEIFSSKPMRKAQCVIRSLILMGVPRSLFPSKGLVSVGSFSMVAICWYRKAAASCVLI